MEFPSSRPLAIPGPGGRLAVLVDGDPAGPPVLMCHSILSSSAMWQRQAGVLARRGMRVIRADTRGHGGSATPPPPYAMEDLVADVVAVLDALRVERVHFVGLSLGGMTGFGLGIRHPERVASLLLSGARADAAPASLSPWDERIATARAGGCAALADSTLLRWFGRAFLDANPDVAERFRATIAATSIDGFVGCANAIQRLDYLPDVHRIAAPTTLVVGANDGPLPEVLDDVRSRIAAAVLHVIADAGHLPNVDRADEFDAALAGHFARVGAIRPA